MVRDGLCVGRIFCRGRCVEGDESELCVGGVWRVVGVICYKVVC